jgi:chromosomal replication initiator protein
MSFIEGWRKLAQLNNRKSLFNFVSLCNQIATWHRKLSYDEIIKQVCSYYNTSYEEINVKSRRRELAEVRQVCMYFGLLLKKMSLSQAGAAFGRDHATALYSRRTIENLIETDKRIREDIKYLKRKLS